MLWSSLVYSGDQFPRTGVLPDNPTTETPITIGIANMLSPCLGSSDTYPTFYHLSESNQITFVFVAVGVNPCIDVPGFGLQYETPALPAGDYSLQVYIVGGPASIPTNINDHLGTALGELIQFSVQGSVAMPVPTLSTIGFVFLIFSMLLYACLKHRKITTLTVLIVFSSAAFSKEFVLLISNENGAPSTEQIVEQANTSPAPGAYMLDSFNDFNPNAVRYFLPERPFGQRLDLINQYPDWTLSKLYRYIIATYDDSIEDSDLINSFASDQFVLNASNLSNIGGSTSVQTGVMNDKPLQQFGGFIGDFINDLDISLAWELSEGMGYIGIIDSGLDIDHSAFRAFSDTGDYLGGNLLDGFYQLDLASGDANVDEQEPFDTGGVASFEACDLADGNDDDMAISIFVGHGTHVSGIIGAKDSGFTGICKNCGMGMMKWTKFGSCLQNFNPPTLGQSVDVAIAGTYLEILSSGGGYGTVNWSGGLFEWNSSFTQIITDEFYCDDVDHQSFCDALQLFRENNVMMVSSGGNNRVGIDFPASEKETVAVVGLTQTGTYWNESPGPGGIFDFSDDSNCPFSGPRNECGSNIGHSPIDQKVDATTQARAVRSTFYPGGRWNDTIGCTDSSDGVSDDGYGLCTGTSMSSPQVAAIIQLFRSTNPLLPNGTFDPNETTGLINILNATSSRSLNGQAVNNNLGYGIPSASLGLEKILGYSNGNIMKTRLTPMFSLYSAETNNNVYSPFPQIAFAFLSQNGADYDSDNNAPLVDEFPSFWHGPNVSLPAPRADFYVFTTNNNPFTGTKNMTPLRRMEKDVGGDRNDTYLTTTAEIEAYHANGYNYAGIEGYILPVCAPMPSCRPTGASRLYRVETDSLNHKLVSVPGTALPAPQNSVWLGFVYENADSDNDGLINGQEIILGTNTLETDSDGDTIPDGVEYPPAGVPFSDPLISDIIFEDGFE